MLLINLIAARRAERRRMEMIRGGLIRGMIVVGAATGIATVFMTVSIQITKNRINDVDQQRAMLQDTVNRVELLQGNMAALRPRVTTLLTAQNATNRWRAVLQEVSTSLPEKTWITSFASQSAPADGFTITGQTKSQDLVGRTMLRMNRQANIQSVNLSYTQSPTKDEGTGATVVNFELAGALHPLEGSTDDSKK